MDYTFFSPPLPAALEEVVMLELLNKAKDVASKTGDKLAKAGKSAADTAGKIGDKAASAAGTAWDSTKETASDAVKKTLA